MLRKRITFDKNRKITAKELFELLSSRDEKPSLIYPQNSQKSAYKNEPTDEQSKECEHIKIRSLRKINY